MPLDDPGIVSNNEAYRLFLFLNGKLASTQIPGWQESRYIIRDLRADIGDARSLVQLVQHCPQAWSSEIDGYVSCAGDSKSVTSVRHTR